ncbi:phasin family protein [Sphingoaurantiacus capsulatus]|uniref:Phasin family protein n=1 Tax=Sphingoaurantiacus capsulatus TaxID=1771310 RepID=A0ABV7X6T5_9SPHN
MATATKTEKTAETIKATAQTAIDQGKAAFEQASTRTREAMDRGVKSLEEINEFNRGNVEALVQSGKAAAQGFEKLAQGAVAFSKKNLEEGTAVVRTLTAAKTPNEFFAASNEYAKSYFDSLVAEMSRVTETSMKVMGEVFEPISNRAALAADKIKTAAVAR